LVAPVYRVVAEKVSLPVGLPVMVQDCRLLVCSDKFNTHTLQLILVTHLN
jgi:hypothetical protein